MSKNLKQIQEENRKLILEGIYGCSYKQAVKTFALSINWGKTYPEEALFYFRCSLSKVLLILKNKVFGNIDLDGVYHKMLFQNDKLLFVHSEGEFYWDLTQETLEDQSEKTQIAINNLLTN